MFLFFDRIYTGAPNITGSFGFANLGNSTYTVHYTTGVFEKINNSPYNKFNMGGYKSNNGNHDHVGINLSRSSTEYNTINEIRVKSIISNGYIKLF